MSRLLFALQHLCCQHGLEDQQASEADVILIVGVHWPVNERCLSIEAGACQRKGVPHNMKFRSGECTSHETQPLVQQHADILYKFLCGAANAKRQRTHFPSMSYVSSTTFINSNRPWVLIKARDPILKSHTGSIIIVIVLEDFPAPLFQLRAKCHQVIESKWFPLISRRPM